MDNATLLRRAGAAFDALGVPARKGEDPEVITTDSVGTGQFMNRENVERLVDLTVGQSGWLAATSFMPVSSQKGQVPRMHISEVITSPSGQNRHRTRTMHPDTDHLQYDCKKYEARFYLTIEDLREAAASGEPDFEAKVQAAFAKAMGNDMARWALLGDQSITNPTTALDELLAHNDGWLKIARSRGVRYASARGTAYSRGVYSRALAMMPEEYADDENLRFMIPRLLDLGWTADLQALGGGSALTDKLLATRARTPILGVPQLIVPQMPVSGGFSILSGTTSAADAVVDDSDGTMTVTVNTLLGGYSTGNAGRKVKITHKTSGLSEVCVVVNAGGANKILTVGSLGQDTISTTASDYTLDVADAASVLLTNPANLFFVLCDKIRAYRVFEEDDERWKFLVKYEADCGIYNEDALVLIDGVVPPAFTEWQ